MVSLLNAIFIPEFWAMVEMETKIKVNMENLFSCQFIFVVKILPILLGGFGFCFLLTNFVVPLIFLIRILQQLIGFLFGQSLLLCCLLLLALLMGLLLLRWWYSFSLFILIVLLLLLVLLLRWFCFFWSFYSVLDFAAVAVAAWSIVS